MNKYEYKFLIFNGNVSTERELKIAGHERDKVISIERLNDLGNNGWRVINCDAHRDLLKGFMHILLEREKIDKDPLDVAIEKAIDEHYSEQDEEDQSEAPTKIDPFVTKQLKK